MKKDYRLLRLQARRLRRKGLSYGEIRPRINVSKSTLSLWLKTVQLKPEHKKRLYTKQIQILSLGPKSQRERRQKEVGKIIEEARKEISRPLPLEAYRLMGAALYWAEGSKNTMFDLTNSDPYLITFWIKWVEKIFDIPSSKLKARLNIYPQQNEADVKRFWADLTGIPLQNFGKSFVKPFSKNYKKNNLYYGTIRIEVPSSTDLRYRVFGWINGVLQDISPNVKLLQRKWSKLQTVPRPVNLK